MHVWTPCPGESTQASTGGEGSGKGTHVELDEGSIGALIVETKEADFLGVVVGGRDAESEKRVPGRGGEGVG